MKKVFFALVASLLLTTGLQAQDTVCPPVTLPWVETFAGGEACWYMPEGSNWHVYDPYDDPSQSWLRHLYSTCNDPTTDSWVMSRAIEIPADTCVTLSWRVASSNPSFVHHYRVLVTTDTDYTDTSNYQLLYLDESTHINFSNYDTLSVRLSHYAGQTIHLAFNNRPIHFNSTWGIGVGLYIDDVTIRANGCSVTPIVNISTPSTHYYAGDTALFVATRVEGSLTGLTYTWHSALKDTTIVGGETLELVYGPRSGKDTVSILLSNYAGSASAMTVVRVTNCESTSTPYFEDFEEVTAIAYDAPGYLPECWGSFYSGSIASRVPHVVTSYPYISNIPNQAVLMWAGASGDRAEVTLPHFDYPLRHLMLAFDYRFENDDKGTLKVGYYDADNNFVTVKTIAPHDDTYRRDTVWFTSSYNADAQIVFRYEFDVSLWAVLLDNISVESYCTPVVDYPWGDTFENYDAGADPGCWELSYSPDLPEGNHWFCAVTGIGNHYMRTHLSSTVSSDWLVTPLLKLPQATPVIAPFFSWRSYTTAPTAVYEVRLSPTGDADTDAFTQLLYTENEPSEWTERSVWLTPYGGQTVRLAFRNIGTGTDYIGLDDIQIGLATPPLPDTTSQEAIDQPHLQAFALYPNPASATVTVRCQRPVEGGWLSLIDVTGRTVLRQAVGQAATLDVGTLPRGVYYVRMEGSAAVRKLVLR